jgi:hypothetical protein
MAQSEARLVRPSAFGIRVVGLGLGTAAGPVNYAPTEDAGPSTINQRATGDEQ